MSVQLYLSPIGLLIQQLSNLGVPLGGGLVNILVAGSVNTPVTTYTDSTGTSTNAIPLVLNSAGRLAASNAPCSVWVPTNTPHKMVLTDSVGNLLAGGACMDNLYGINDPFALLTLLANPASGSGSDLVANAVRSYDVINSVRAANVPSLSAGQTLVIDVEGGTLVNDGNGGIFYWSATSTATDDGATVIKPSSITSANPGRYLRQSNLFGSTGSFTMGVTGLSSAPTVTCNWVKNGQMVTVSIGGASGTSNSTAFGLTGYLPALQGATSQALSPNFPAEDNTALGVECYLIIPTAAGGTSPILTINNASGLWTGSGTKAFNQMSFSYIAH